MNYQSLVNVLGILRLIKSDKENRTTAALIAAWANEPRRMNYAATLRVAIYVTEQIEQAMSLIANSSLDEEARHGVDQALKGLAAAFSPAAINNKPMNHIKDIDGAISHFALLLRYGGVDTNSGAPPEAADLAKEIEELSGSLKNAGLDPEVRDLCRRHLQILATMLRHIPIFGLDAALATYFELMLRMRRAEAQSNPEKKEAAKPIMKRLKDFGTTLKNIDETMSTAENLAGKASGLVRLLGYISS